jgi:hypothetical protein
LVQIHADYDLCALRSTTFGTTSLKITSTLHTETDGAFQAQQVVAFSKALLYVMRTTDLAIIEQSWHIFWSRIETVSVDARQTFRRMDFQIDSNPLQLTLCDDFHQQDARFLASALSELAELAGHRFTAVHMRQAKYTWQVYQRIYAIRQVLLNLGFADSLRPDYFMNSNRWQGFALVHSARVAFVNRDDKKLDAIHNLLREALARYVAPANELLSQTDDAGITTTVTTWLLRSTWHAGASTSGEDVWPNVPADSMAPAGELVTVDFVFEKYGVGEETCYRLITPHRVSSAQVDHRSLSKY